MHRHKSERHVKAANARWRNAEARAAMEREYGIPDRIDADCRQPLDLDLRSAGGPLYRIEPRLGYVAWRAIDQTTGTIEHCAALKELLHKIADDLPRMLSARTADP